jgi:hypothetical protein
VTREPIKTYSTSGIPTGTFAPARRPRAESSTSGKTSADTHATSPNSSPGTLAGAFTGSARFT